MVWARDYTACCTKAIWGFRSARVSLARETARTMTCDIPYGPEQKPWKATLSPWAKSGDNFLVTPPSVDPLSCYSFPKDERDITPKLYQVPSTGLEAKHCNQAQAETALRVTVQTENYLGYQGTTGTDYTVVSSYLCGTHTNGVGDPFLPRPAKTLSMKWMERNVLDYYASLWNAKWPHVRNDPETYWGYILSMGSTEGNLYGLWSARDYLKGKSTTHRDDLSIQAKVSAKNPNAYTPVAFYSQDAHYSITKLTRVLEIQTFHEVGTTLYSDSCPLGGDWPAEVPCEGGDEWNGPGSIDISKLCKLVDFFTAKGYPALIIFNYGTTFKGAYDDVKKAGEQLMPILERNGMKERLIEIKDRRDGRIIQHRCKGYWIHVDGALGASYMPFVHMALEKHCAVTEPAPHFDFRLPFVCSIVTSGHKFPGAPWPTGIYMTKTGLQLSPPSSPGFLGPDTTLAGSRNALSTLIWWTYISTHNYDNQVEMVLRCLDLARYAESKLKQLEKERGEDLWVARNPSALNVHFKIPNDDIVYKYTLGKQIITLKGECRTYTHIYCMGGTTKEKLDELFKALRVPDAFPVQPTSKL